MALNTLFVSLDGNDAIAQPGNPLRPYTLQGAIALQNSVSNAGTWFFNLASGNYNVPCGSRLIFRRNTIVSGSGPRNTILTIPTIEITNGIELVMNSMAFRSCDSTPLFQITSGTITLSNSEVTVTSGTAYVMEQGMLITNGCVFNISGTSTNPVLDTGTGGLMSTNTNYNFRLDGGIPNNISLIGGAPNSGFTLLTNVNVRVSTPKDSTNNVIPFYNVNSIHTATVTAMGSGRETMILVAVDTQTTTTPTEGPNTSIVNPPFYATDIAVSVRNYAHTYTYYNMYNYPLVMRNITWSGVASSPGAFIPNRLPTQLPPDMNVAQPASVPAANVQANIQANIQANGPANGPANVQANAQSNLSYGPYGVPNGVQPRVAANAFPSPVGPNVDSGCTTGYCGANGNNNLIRDMDVSSGYYTPYRYGNNYQAELSSSEFDSEIDVNEDISF